jgi:pyruvate dehydrogenase E2 component (dihydrolipoamide acetyltransferase)
MAEVTMPKMGDAMEEGTLREWLKKEGEEVQEQEPIAAIETEKSTIEIPSFYTGRLSQILVREGETVPVGTAIAVIDTGNGDAAAAAAPAPAENAPQPGRAATRADREPKPGTGTPRPASGSPRAGNGPTMNDATPASPIHAPAAPTDSAPSTTPAAGERVKASPLARKVAAERGVDLAQVQGSGPGGRVVEADIEEYLRREPAAPAGAHAAPQAPPAVEPAREPERAPQRPAPPAPATAATPAPQPAPAAPSSGVTEHELSPIRRTIARRLVESKRDIPHYYVTSSIDMRAVAAMRDQINAQRAGEPKISYNDFIVRACALALRKFPTVNAQLVEGRLRTIESAHVGIAVALPEGLIVPVLREADRKSLSQISAEAHALAERARAGRLKPEEYSGGTFTISNLGMYDVESFTGIINPPECALLAVGGIQEVPVVAQGQIIAGLRMRVTLSADHRVIDGAVAAQFLQEVKRLLQEPLLLV